MVSHWEKGVSSPPIEPFLILCELYEVEDIQETFRGAQPSQYSAMKLNKLGLRRVEEYIALLSSNTLYCEAQEDETAGKSANKNQKHIRLYDIPVAAGAGIFLDSDSYTEIEVDSTVPKSANYAVKVSGDSMTPRFADGQVVFVREQETLELGDVGIFSLNGNAYIKKMGHGELLSLNTRYEPIKLTDYDSVRVFGKVVG
jgi:SOS-response transcriptional repressor LexA